MAFRVVSEPDASRDDIRLIQNAGGGQRLAAPERATAFDVVIALRDDHNRLLGGALGDLADGWLRALGLWVDSALPEDEFAAKLLQAAETEAARRGVRGGWLETHSPATRRFYEKQGYSVFASMEDFPPGHYYYMMRKTFASAETA